MLSTRSPLITLLLCILISCTLNAQTPGGRLLIPATRLSLQPQSDHLTMRQNTSELRGPDGRSVISFTIFTEENLDLLHQSVMGTLPSGPRDTVWVLAGEAFIEHMIDNRVAGGQTHRYAGSIRLKDGRYLGLTASVFAGGVNTHTMIEQTLQSLAWEEELAPVFYNSAFSFDPKVLPLQHCRERLSVHPIIFSANGQCSASGPTIGAISITNFGKRGLRGSAVVMLLGDLYHKYDAGLLQTEHGWWRRYIRPASPTEPATVLYQLQRNEPEIIVQVIAPDPRLTIPLLDQFVATFEPH